ncbi:hypothetical protein DPEC_G00178050 [Dallia pectoralis]|uniref:Uncharacterized protein n=1 Tax=Dallia pectoralis TaxID=75939 RepID=A0ACC2GFL6_DALPE|nr:hypothetical protein DPEC_G00178050 [Dallia pectoralis]
MLRKKEVGGGVHPLPANNINCLTSSNQPPPSSAGKTSFALGLLLTLCQSPGLCPITSLRPQSQGRRFVIFTQVHKTGRKRGDTATTKPLAAQYC